DGDFFDAAHRALELETLAFGENPLPAALGLFAQHVEALGDVFGRRNSLRGVAEDRRPHHAGDRGLFDYFAVIAAVQPGERGANAARFFDNGLEIGAGALVA